MGGRCQSIQDLREQNPGAKRSRRKQTRYVHFLLEAFADFLSYTRQEAKQEVTKNQSRVFDLLTELKWQKWSSEPVKVEKPQSILQDSAETSRGYTPMRSEPEVDATVKTSEQ